jgi:hypothetical protein
MLLRRRRFRINLRAGVLDLVRAIDLVTITAEGKITDGKGRS